MTSTPTRVGTRERQVSRRIVGVWRWELRAVPGGTEVTETFDHTAKRCPAVVAALGIPERAGKAIDATLSRLHARLA